MSELIALLDIGSNAARFVLVRIQPGKAFRVLRKDRFQTRLGAGRPGVLSRAAMRETIRSAKQFLADVQQTQKIQRVLAIATSAVRDAQNQAVFVESFGRATGVTLEVLSGEEEARLGARTALHELAPQSGVVFDLGGGSLQLSHIRRGKIVNTDSLPLGVVRMTTQFLRHDPPRTTELRALRHKIRSALTARISPAPPEAVLIGMGGSIRALTNMWLAARRRVRIPAHGVSIPRSEVVSFLERVVGCGPQERDIPGLEPDRIDVIGAGLVIIEEILLAGQYPSVRAFGNGGVRHGILLRETFGDG